GLRRKERNGESGRGNPGGAIGVATALSRISALKAIRRLRETCRKFILIGVSFTCAASRNCCLPLARTKRPVESTWVNSMRIINPCLPGTHSYLSKQVWLLHSALASFGRECEYSMLT